MRRLVLFTALVLATASLAQDKNKKPSGEAVTYKKTTEFTFSDETIDGELMRPDGEYVQARKRSKQPNLLRLREEFRKKVLSSATSL
jgi:hypothetical protein